MAKTTPAPTTTRKGQQSPVKAPTQATQVDIWITEPLKQAAKALQISWSRGQEERTAELNIRDVELKFTNSKELAAFLGKLKSFAQLSNPNFPSTY